MTPELYEIFFVGGAAALAVLLVRFRIRQKRRARELSSMARLLAAVCK